MVFEVPSSNGKLKANRFEFTIGGHPGKFSVPKLQYLTGDMVGVLKAIEENQSAGLAAIDLMYQVFGTESEKTAAAIKTLDVEQINALFLGWTEASNVTPGELEAS